MRPVAWLGRFANSTFERVFVNGALVGGATGAVRALSAAVRGIQSGYLRYYAALLLVGLTGLSAYFLISAWIHLTILVFFPVVCGLLAAFSRAGHRHPDRDARSRSSTR